MKFKLNQPLILVILLISISCASFQKKVVIYGNVTHGILNQISTSADLAVVNKTMSSAQRQVLAKTYLVPSLTALDELITVARTWKEGEPIPAQVKTLTSVIGSALVNFTSTLPDSNDKLAIENNLKQVLATLDRWIQEFQ